MSAARRLVLASAALLAACSSVSTARIRPESVHVGPNLRPIAIVRAEVTSAYLLFIPLPGNVSRDRVDRMLSAAARALGADKVVDVTIDLSRDDGAWALRRLLGYRRAEARGIAVVVEEPGHASPMASKAHP
jgi:ABC-type sugar transport system substrate-binding protein